MKLLKLFEEDEEEILTEEIYCTECGQTIEEDNSYYSAEAEEVFCSYECYVKKLNREYFE